MVLLMSGEEGARMEFEELGAATHVSAVKNLARNGLETLDMVNTGGWVGASSSVSATPFMQKPLTDLSLCEVLKLEAGKALNGKQHA